MYLIYVHMQDAAPILMETKTLPSRTDTVFIGDNPRLQDGSRPPNLREGTTKMVIPLDRILFIEVEAMEESEAGHLGFRNLNQP
ncbi:hypothetical protein MASR2M15_24420 [Anaerolineales bacterium]